MWRIVTCKDNLPALESIATFVREIKENRKKRKRKGRDEKGVRKGDQEMEWNFPGGPVAPKAGDLGLIPDQGAHMPQLKTWPSQIK